MPDHPSEHSHSFAPPLGERSLPSGNAPHSGSEQSSPPKPGPQLHLPLALLQSANCLHLKSSRLQLKHGGHPSGRSPYMEKSDCGDSARE
jgi:hypothetical protein